MYARFLPRRASLWSSYATRSAADGYLVELLKSEIEQAKHKLLYDNGDVKEEMVGPFVLTDKAGMEEVVLTRTTGKEKIEILCMLEKQYPEDEDEPDEQRLQHRHQHHYNKHKFTMNEGEEEIVEVLHLSLCIRKGDNIRLELDCSFVRGASEVMIEDALLHEADPTDSEGAPEPYGGPVFEDLGENLQRAFHELLKAKGLTSKVAWQMMDYMCDKEQREYVRWLQRLKDFLTN
ncbi:hypothetical protein GOP47_0023675 [Adiantum capillus-veneris]|uniref:Mitochondrial glycoprotein n=1 Tax=Adiantum capillus-veneris TaxID=13818 RepID=A0A9D4U4Z1_ADICA|nr:hypothetical protein GOP47_0023675 [Adiantum capillus-veneris]